jgi:hypothetical protein
MSLSGGRRSEYEREARKDGADDRERVDDSGSARVVDDVGLGGRDRPDRRSGYPSGGDSSPKESTATRVQAVWGVVADGARRASKPVWVTHRCPCGRGRLPGRDRLSVPLGAVAAARTADKPLAKIGMDRAAL